MKTNIKQRIGALATTVAILGVVVSPAIASAASQSTNTNVSVDVGSSISINALGTVSISITPTAGGAVSSAKDTVTVSTNNTLGYNLTVIDSDTTTNLTSGGNNFTTVGSTTVPATLTNGKWGFAVASGTTGVGVSGFDASYSPAESNATSSTSKWVGMPASSGSATVIKSTSTTATNDAVDVWYAAKADTSQPNGTYTDTVTYTATTK